MRETEEEKMFTLNENEREYRHGDHGPKYLEQGPRMNFGLVRLRPGDTVAPHVHRVMQESFYILEGSVTISVLREDGAWADNRLEKGDYLHLEPGEAHKIRNEGAETLRMAVTAAPYAEGDKESV